METESVSPEFEGILSEVIFNGSSDCILIIDDQGRFLNINPAGCKLLNHTREDLLNLTVYDFVPASEVERIQQCWDDSVASGEQTCTFLVTTNKERQIWIDFQAISTVKPGMRLVILRNITERIASQEIFTTIFEKMDQGIAFQAADGSVSMMNPAAEKILGVKKEKLLDPEAVSQTIKIVREDKSPYPAEEHPAMRTLRTGKPIKNEIMGVLQPDDKTYHWIQVSTVPMYREHETEPFQVFATFSDVTDLRQAELEVEMEKDRTQHYLDSAKVMFLGLDPKGKINLVNKEACRILGYSPQELLGTYRYDRYLPSGILEETHQKFSQLTKGKVTENEHENPVITKDGETRIILWQDTLTYDDEGEIIGLFSSGQDITEGRKAETDMLLRAQLLDYATDGISLLDWNGDLIYVNESFCKLHGLQKDELIGMNMTEIPSTATPELFAHISSELSHKGYVLFETTHFNKDGVPIELEVHAQSMEVNGKRYSLNIERDITERKRVQEELNKSRENYRNLFQNAPIGITVSTLDGEIIDTNKALLEMHGYSSLEDIRKSTVEERYLNVRDRDNWIKILNRDGIINNFEMILKRKDGSQFWASLNSIPTMTELSPNQLITVVRDISESKKLQEEQEKAARLESVGILAGGIAHDFNNILTAILGNIQLSRSYIEKKQIDIADKILEEAEQASVRATLLTRQLLTFSQGGAPIKQLVQINKLIKESITFALRGSNVRAVFDIPDDLWPINADEGQINQVISNLIINADQAMPEGGKIEIKAKNIEIRADKRELPLKEGNYIELAITDHGSGIPNSHFDKIFDPYFTTKQKGSGLGLTTSYSIVKNHGGYITFTSEIDDGTTFTIFLPAERDKVIKDRVDDRQTTIPPKKPLRILIMDDEETILALLERMLTSVGYQVDVSRNGREAIDLYIKAQQAGETYSAVILDLTVPGGIGGKEVIDRLLELDPKVNAIVSSGYATDSIMADHEKFGFKGVVAKPYRIEEMQRVLQDVLNNDE